MLQTGHWSRCGEHSQSARALTVLALTAAAQCEQAYRAQTAAFESAPKRGRPRSSSC